MQNLNRIHLNGLRAVEAVGAVEALHVGAVLVDPRDLAILEVHHPPGVADDRLGIAGDDGLAVAEHVAQSSLSGYKKPRRYGFVDELPRGNTGKVSRKLLRDKVLEGDRK